MTKHEIREYAFLLLYEAMVQGIHAEETADLYATTEEMLNLPVGDRVKRLVDGVLTHTEELDAIIEAHSKQRTLNRVPAVNRTILRLALYELRTIPETPEMPATIPAAQ